MPVLPLFIILRNKSATTPWDISAFGFRIAVAPSTDLQVDSYKVDFQLKLAIRVGILTLSAENVLVIPDPLAVSGEREISDSQEYWCDSAPTITQWDHANPMPKQIVQKNSSGTLTGDDLGVVLCLGTFTLTLPPATSFNVGQSYFCNNVGTGVITFNGAITTNFELLPDDSIEFISKGPNWEPIFREVHSPPSTKVYIDKGRSDIYVEDGTREFPFKAVTSAISAHPSGAVILYIAKGVYSGDLVLGQDMNLSGSHMKDVDIDGNITTNASGFTALSDLHCRGIIITNCQTKMTRVSCISELRTNANTTLIDCELINATKDAPIWKQSGGEIQALSCAIQVNNNNAIESLDGSSGSITLTACSVTNNSAVSETINIRAGSTTILKIESGVVVNNGGGDSVCINTTAPVGTAVLHDVFLDGDVDIYNTPTSIIGEHGNITISAQNEAYKLFQKASRLTNDSSVPGNTVKDALENLLKKTMHFSFSDGAANPYIEGSATNGWEAFSTVLFSGSDFIGIPNVVAVIISNSSAGGGCDWQILDITNASNVIASGGNPGTGTTPTIDKDSSLTNISTSEAQWEFQIRRNPTLTGKARISSLEVRFNV